MAHDTLGMIAENGLRLRATIAAGAAADVLRRHAEGNDASALIDAVIATTPTTIPGEAVRLLVEVLDDLAEGKAVAVAPADLRIGTTEAARLLGVSRAWVAKLVDDGALPGDRTGSKRRIALHDVLRERRSRARRLVDAVSTWSGGGDDSATPQPMPTTSADAGFVLPDALWKRVPTPAHPAMERGHATYDVGTDDPGLAA